MHDAPEPSNSLQPQYVAARLLVPLTPVMSVMSLHQGQVVRRWLHNTELPLNRHKSTQCTISGCIVDDTQMKHACKTPKTVQTPKTVHTLLVSPCCLDACRHVMLHAISLALGV